MPTTCSSSISSQISKSSLLACLQSAVFTSRKFHRLVVRGWPTATKTSVVDENECFDRALLSTERCVLMFQLAEAVDLSTLHKLFICLSTSYSVIPNGLWKLACLEKRCKKFRNIKRTTVIQKVCSGQKTEGKFAQKWDYHLIRSNREFWCSLKNHLKQALTMLPKATRSSSLVVFSSSKALMKFPHTHTHALPNKSPTVIIRTLLCST
jgi:hypothetical protein